MKQLKYFVKVAELEHFGQASEQLNVVQPALSRQVKQLEEELGVQLFERLPRGVRLTSAGRLLLDRSRVLLAEVDSMTVDIKRAGAGKFGKLRVAFADGATFSGHAPQIIASFRNSHPDVQLELIPATSLEQSALLKAGQIDVAFVYWLPKDAQDLQWRDLNKEKIMLAAAKSNPLSAKKKVKMRDLTNSRFVWFKREVSPPYYDLILTRCAKAGLTLDVVQDAIGESTILTLVSTDIGVTFMTESARARKPDNVVLIDVEDLDIFITLKCLWRKNDKNSALAEFLNTIKR